MAVALLANWLAAQAPVAPVAPVWAARAEAAILEKQKAAAIPGISCAIARVDAGVVFARGYGEADVENAVPATAATVYRLASISKPITAICALRLAEALRLDLDADVHTFVPEWPAKQWPVSTRQLLGHLGGVRHYRGEAESTVHHATQRAGLVRFAADPLVHEPGTAHLYSTYGFNLAAAAIEVAAAKSFPEVVRELVAGPSGAATLQDDDPGRVIPHRAQGYVRVDQELRNSALMDASYKLGGGGLCCSAEDLARVGVALLAGKLLRPESLTAM
ncbi:MAG: beta-lactamase family protein, partial [Planctomycetes bacterium]|nr:beta-lactamase family protein [Planctomycetota bacterium]